MPAPATAVRAAQETFNIDVDHSEVGFAVRHLMVSTVKGSFRRVTGKIVLDTRDITKSYVEAEIDADSIDTRQEQRDTHLRSADFFDAATYPTLVFKSRTIQTGRDGKFVVVGDLTIRDVTKQVTLDVDQLSRGNDPWGGERIGFTAHTSIDRTDYGLTWNQVLETGGIAVSNEVKITLEIEAVLS
jgi:polyisoprenoid-binding protein YceI